MYLGGVLAYTRTETIGGATDQAKGASKLPVYEIECVAYHAIQTEITQHQYEI